MSCTLSTSTMRTTTTTTTTIAQRRRAVCEHLSRRKVKDAYVPVFAAY
jgi:hypothetical protein